MRHCEAKITCVGVSCCKDADARQTNDNHFATMRPNHVRLHEAAKQIFIPSYCGSCLRTDLTAIGASVLLCGDCMSSKSRP